jgi:hypothetical protein
MRTSGSRRLADYPDEIVRLRCTREGCGKSWNVSKQKLIARCGPDIALPDLAAKFEICEGQTPTKRCFVVFEHPSSPPV